MNNVNTYYELTLVKEFSELINDVNNENSNQHYLLVLESGSLARQKKLNKYFLNKSLLKKFISDCETVGEPVDKWNQLIDKDGKNILAKFYEDMKRWSYSFQNVACISRMQKIEDTITKSDAKIIFLDRSLGTDKNVFEKMLYDNGQISEIEHQMYNMWCDFYHQYVRPEFNNIIIYLRCTAETAKTRINKRGRKEEEGITLEYLRDLRKYHEEWLMSENKTNVIVIDCDREFESDLEYQREIIKQVEDGIQNIKIDKLADSIKNHIEISNDNNSTEITKDIYNKK
jgi:deoxyadenosine/deoxycytidine kinase